MIPFLKLTFYTYGQDFYIVLIEDRIVVNFFVDDKFILLDVKL